MNQRKRWQDTTFLPMLLDEELEDGVEEDEQLFERNLPLKHFIKHLVCINNQFSASTIISQK